MALLESVSKLQSLLSVLGASDAKFAADLIASFKKYGNLTPKQAPWIDKLIARAEAPKPQAAAPVNVGGFAGVLALFNAAKAHLKFPKVRLVVGGVKVTLSLNGPKSKNPGFVSISGEGVYPNRSYYGRVSPEGTFTPAQATYGAFLTALTTVLTDLSSNPARVAKEHGKLTGNCCFCNKVLGLGKEQRSVLVGFGPDCAEHYGLKAEWLAAAEKAEAKASVAPSVTTVTPKSQAQVMIDTAAATLPVTSQAVMAAKLAANPSENPYSADEQAVSPVQAVADAKLAEKAQVEALAAELQEFGEPVLSDAQIAAGPETCFFCEASTFFFKKLNDYVVCAECAKQLA